MHPAVAQFLRLAPEADCKQLALLLNIEIRELDRVKERVKALFRTHCYSPFSLWSYVRAAADFTVQGQCSWLRALKDGSVLAFMERFKDVNDPIWTLSSLVDKQEVLKDGINYGKFMAAAPNKGWEHSLAASQKQNRQWQANMARELKAISKERAYANPGQQKWHGQPKEQQNEQESELPKKRTKSKGSKLRKQFNDLVFAKNKELKAEAKKICAFFANGVTCPDYNPAVDKKFCHAMVQGKDIKRAHHCLCNVNVQHNVMVCRIWHKPT